MGSVDLERGLPTAGVAVRCAAAGCRTAVGAVDVARPLTGAAMRAADGPVLHDVSARLTMAAGTRRDRLFMRPRMLRDDERIMKSLMP